MLTPVRLLSPECRVLLFLLLSLLFSSNGQHIGKQKQSVTLQFILTPSRIIHKQANEKKKATSNLAKRKTALKTKCSTHKDKGREKKRR